MRDISEVVKDMKDAYIVTCDNNGASHEEDIKLFDNWFENAYKLWQEANPPTDTWHDVYNLSFGDNPDIFENWYVGWDIEIAKDLPDDAEWQDYAPLGITCGAISRGKKVAGVWRSDDNGPMSRGQCRDMVGTLYDLTAKGYLITTWNGLSFDFQVLAMESEMYKQCAELAIMHVDMMFHVVCAKGFGVSLDSVANAMDVEGKTDGMSGALAPILWRNGDYNRVLGYVAQDARSTALVAKACEDNNRMNWITRKGKKSYINLTNGWLRVRDANKLPVPDTSWMDDDSIWDRDRFLGWTKEFVDV